MSSSFLPEPETRDKTQSEVCSISEGPRTTDHLYIPGSVMETMTDSLFSRAPGQEREMSTETVTSLLFSEFRDRKEKHWCQANGEDKIYPSMWGLTEETASMS